VNAKAITDAMGHASVTMTFDRYGHLMPDGRDEARARVDAYLQTGHR
jgi:integrase